MLHSQKLFSPPSHQNMKRFLNWIDSLEKDQSLLIFVGSTPPTQIFCQVSSSISRVRSRVFVLKFVSGFCSVGIFQHWTDCGTVLLQIHRSFFAQALLDHPVDPLQSPFSHSCVHRVILLWQNLTMPCRFEATYRSASWLIKAQAYNFRRYPELMSRRQFGPSFSISVNVLT